MDHFHVITEEHPGVSLLKNYDELKSYLEQRLSVYEDLAYTADRYQDAKKDQSDLNKLKKAINDKKKEIKAVYMAPYLETEEKLNELISLIDRPLALIKEFISEVDTKEKEETHRQAVGYYRSVSAGLGDLADRLLEAPLFYEKSWDNKSTRLKARQDAILEKVKRAEKDIAGIQAVGGAHAAALLAKYFETLDMEAVKAFRSELEKAANAADAEVIVSEDADRVVGYQIVKLTGTRGQLAQLMDQAELLGIDVELIEDGMPQDLKERTEPDFDSFVAFDIEHSGTFGAAAGDAPPEITEIGAVKVIGGKVVDQFDMLANPGRKITPQNERLTHITNEMVKDAPPVAEVIRAFREYCGDLVLVGHNIRSVDLPYIVQAGKKAGVAFENEFFDTYVYAKKYKDAMNWDNVKLEYLAGQFGIEDKAHHRAYNDAEVNVDVYFKLKELNK